jgi:hypothetical protein
MAATRVVVHTVDFGQPLHSLRAFVSGRGLRHVIQPLQRKEDYRQSYAHVVPSAEHGRTGACEYIRRPHMRYFNIEGVEMPCPFIKDVGEFRGTAWLRGTFAAREMPGCCRGCAALT